MAAAAPESAPSFFEKFKSSFESKFAVCCSNRSVNDPSRNGDKENGVASPGLILVSGTLGRAVLLPCHSLFLSKLLRFDAIDQNRKITLYFLLWKTRKETQERFPLPIRQRA